MSNQKTVAEVDQFVYLANKLSEQIAKKHLSPLEVRRLTHYANLLIYEVKMSNKSSGGYYKLLANLPFDNRTQNIFRRFGLKTVADLLTVINGDLQNLMRIKNIGPKSIEHIRQVLVSQGVLFSSQGLEYIFDEFFGDEKNTA